METQSLTDLLAAQWPWVSRVAVFIGVARLLIKPVGTWLQGVLTDAITKASLSLDPTDDTFIEEILRSRWYRALRFLVDLGCSVKLPESTAFPAQTSNTKNQTP